MSTKIDYLDRCVNIINGCDYNCSYCWARRRMAPRLAHRCKKCGTFTPHFHPERLEQLGRIKGPSIVGLNFMGDTFGAGVDQHWRKAIWDIIMDNPARRNNFVVLTKQPQNIKNEQWGNRFPMEYLDNLWVGVSIENIDHIDRWVALSQKEYIRHKIISFEPVLGDFEFSKLKLCFSKYGYPSWIIIGALTKFDKDAERNSRYRALDLINIIRRIDKDIPVFVKSNVGAESVPREFPSGLGKGKVS